MAKFRLTRRSVIRGAGGIAIALPWMEIMGLPRRARAQTAVTPAKRFLSVYQPGGTVIAKWRPTGTETAPVLSPILAPFEMVKDKILIVDGLDMKTAAIGLGEQHQSGIIGWLTGIVQMTAQQYPMPGGPSIDQVLANKIAGTRAKKSIQVAVRWATGKSHGLLSPINSANFEDGTTHSPIPPRLDPVEIWNDLFGTLDPSMANANAARIARQQSILDFVDKRYVALSARLGAGDKQKLDEHLTKIREIENGLKAATGAGTARCVQPIRPINTGTATAGQINVADYNPRSGLNSADNGSIKDTSTDAAIPKVGKVMMDMLVMAFACDLTAVASLQWSDTEAKHTFPWLNLSEHHHFYQHDNGYQPVQCEQIATWYSTQHAYLVDAMSKIDMGGHTLLDESVVFFGSELQEPPTHLKGNMPFVLAGKGGGLRPGRWLKYAGSPPHNNLLVSILNLFGDTRTTFGDPKYNTGALTNLT